MVLSASPYLRVVVVILATIIGSYAYRYIANPLSAVEIFEFERSPSAAERDIFDTLMRLLGAKVCFMSFALYAAALFASSKLLGSLLLALSCTAFMDGYIVLKLVGHGEWNHWGYARYVFVVGLLLLGVLDRKPKKDAPAEQPAATSVDGLDK